jgi:hypothetical protein
MKTVFILFAILLCTIASTAFGAEGNELGNGGDLVSQEFIAAGRRLVDDLRAKPDPRIPDVDKLAAAVEAVKVTSTSSLTLHGAEVDAINYPEELEIDVNRPRWQAASPEKHASLVLHEYLGIIQVNDLHYEISGSYAQPFAIPEEKPKKFEAAIGSSYGWTTPFESNREHSNQPGVSASFGYFLNTRSELLLGFERQSFGSSYGDSWTDSRTQTAATAGYRWWFMRGKTWSPYVQANAGIVWQKSEFSFPSYSDPYAQYHWEGSDGKNLLLQLGSGVRYALLRDVNLDLGVGLQSIGTPWKRWDYGGYNKNITMSTAVGVMF